MDIQIVLDDILSKCRRDSERKQDRSRRTEQQILAAALRVFARDGVSRARIADIAAEAGISTSTLYEYHASKEDIAYAVPMSYLADFYGEVTAALARQTSAHDRVLAYLSTAADFARRHADWARLHYLELWPSVLVRESPLDMMIGEFNRLLVALIQQGMNQGEWSAGIDPEETAAILTGAVNQLIVTWLLYRRPRNLTKSGAALVQRMLTMLRNEGRSSTSSQPPLSSKTPPSTPVTADGLDRRA